jgi:hypothetical protein
MQTQRERVFKRSFETMKSYEDRMRVYMIQYQLDGKGQKDQFPKYLLAGMRPRTAQKCMLDKNRQAYKLEDVVRSVEDLLTIIKKTQADANPITWDRTKDIRKYAHDICIC